MKKIIIFLISILLLAGCNNSSEDDSYKKLFLQNTMSEKNRYDKTIPDIVPVYNKECHTELNDESEKKWLILMYLAGDSDSIEKDLLGNMVSVSIGMSHSNADIKTIALYDRHSDLTEKPNYIIIDSGTHIFDIKPNSSCTEQFIADYCKTDVPSDWLHVDSTGKTEADTGSYMTMGKFIKWAEETYNPDNERTTIFIVGSHGFGTTGTVSSRTFCPDFNSRNIIHTNEIPKAFDYAGITSENKFEAVIYDVCLCGTLEEAYEIRNYAKSFICSSNETPKAGFPYEKIIANICKNTTICEIGINFVNCFANDYKTKSYKNRPATISFIDLSKIKDIAETTTDLSNELLKLPDVSFIKSNKYLKNEGYESKNNVNYECSYIDIKATSVNYTKFYSYDLGFFADKLYDYAVKNSLINVSEHCTTLKNQLSQAVVCSWRGNNNKTENGSYPEFNNSSNYYGLTITGDAENSALYGYRNPYYLTTFAFNTDTTWKNLLAELYPEQFK